MQKKLIVLLDIDGTTGKFHPAWFAAYNALCRKRGLDDYFTETMAVEWNVHGLCKFGDVMEEALHTKGLYRNLELFPGALEVLRDLQDICEFWVVSATPDYAQKERDIWISRTLGGLVTRVIYTHEKDRIHADIRFDDNADWIDKGDGLRVLMHQPWNRKARRSKFDVRVFDWKGFHRAARNYYEERVAACA